jgi:hypothetical protein
MALTDKKQVTLTKQELLVLEELIADYASSGDSYSFHIGGGLAHTEEQMEELFFKLQTARFSRNVR